MGENPYAAPQTKMINEREHRRILRKRAAIAAAIDGSVVAAILDFVPVFVFGLSLPANGILTPGWLISLAGILLYSTLITVTGTSIGGLLTRTRESRQESTGWTVFVVLFRTFWPLPFAVGGTIAALYIATLFLSPELGLRPDVSGPLFVVGPWVIPFIAWLFVRLRRETWQLAHTVLLRPAAD